MTNFNGSYKAEWKKRAKFFEKEADISKKPVIKTVWAPKIYNPFHKKKKTEDTNLEKVFGHMDKTYRAMKDARPDTFRSAAQEFRTAIEAATRQGRKSIVLVMMELDAKGAANDMSTAEKKQHAMNVKDLNRLFERDLEAILHTARAAFFREVTTRNADGTNDWEGSVRALSDHKVRKAAMRSNITKGLSWLNKLDRNPTVENFNAGCEQACRDITAQIVVCRGVFTTARDKKVLDAVHKVLAPFGNDSKQLTDKDGFEAVMGTSVTLRKAMQTLGQWAKSIKT
jgi:hypothetical protein